MEEAEEFWTMFTNFDRDKSGTISCVELRTVVRQLGYGAKNKTLYELVCKVDVDGSG